MVHGHAAYDGPQAADFHGAGYEGAVGPLWMLLGPGMVVASYHSSGACRVWSTASMARLYILYLYH